MDCCRVDAVRRAIASNSVRVLNAISSLIPGIPSYSIYVLSNPLLATLVWASAMTTLPILWTSV